MITLSKQAYDVLNQYVKELGKLLSGCLEWKNMEEMHDLHERAVYAIKEGLEVGEKKRLEDNKVKSMLIKFEKDLKDELSESPEKIGEMISNDGSVTDIIDTEEPMIEMNKVYFNTTNETGEELKKAQEKSIEQNDVVLYYYWCRAFFPPILGATPSKCHETLCRILKKEIPITSIRRSITNLTKQGKLVKTDEKRVGPHGRKEYVWRLA